MMDSDPEYMNENEESEEENEDEDYRPIQEDSEMNRSREASYTSAA